ncbi:MAG: HlyC/CorC family transporter [Candidatus Latescibacteria bacterium]|nr:HlyC/CorC family transporter [Candidatus Latescibacterota bacterium]
MSEALHVGQVLLIPLLVLGNAFFVAAEFALVTVRGTRLEELASKGVLGVGSAQEAARRIDDTIAATQLGITMMSLALGWIGEPGLAHFVEPWFAFLPERWSPFAAHGVATALAFLAITFLHVVVGELAPKTIALRIPDSVAIRVAGPLLAFERVFRPFIALMNNTGNWLVRLLGFKPAAHAQHLHSVHELQLLVEDVSEAGRMTAEHATLLKNAFRLPEKKVGEAMVPLRDAHMLDLRSSPDHILNAVQDSIHTRFPVYDGDRAHIVGIVNAKDLFFIYSSSGLINLADAMYPVTWAPSDRSIADQLKELRRMRRQMAIVVDAAGHAVGFITLEDIIEELVGEIEDEHDVRGVREAVEAAAAVRSPPRGGREE